MKTITLDEFIKKEQERLMRFKEDWKMNQLKEHEFYPDELFSGDWDEQLQSFGDR